MRPLKAGVRDLTMARYILVGARGNRVRIRLPLCLGFYCYLTGCFFAGCGTDCLMY